MKIPACMKTTKLISLVCSLLSCAVLRAEAMGADLVSGEVARDGRITEGPSLPVVESLSDSEIRKGGNKADTLISLSVISIFGLVVVLTALVRAPGGYENGTGFHRVIRRERTNPVRHVRRSLAPI